MKIVFLLIDTDKNVVAIYDDETLANTMAGPVEEKLGIKVTVEKRSVNLDIKTIGVFK